MSYDRQIDQVCPHMVVEEPLYVNPDRRSVRPLRPIASADSVSVRMDGQYEVPSAGTFTPAITTGSRRGPFTIKTGVNDTFRVTVGTTATQTLVVPASNRMALDRLIALLNTQAKGVYFGLRNGLIQLQTQDSGPHTRFFIEPGSTLAELFGMGQNREYRGRQIAPGWTLIRDPLTLSDRPTRLIVFDEPLKSAGDFVEVSYSTIRQECRRCGGLGIENDWRYGNDGNTGEVRDEALLVQEIQKLFYTLLGSNPFHTWYGTGLLETIGKKLSASGLVQNLILSDIQQAFGRWQSIKKQQENDVGQKVSDREFPYQLLSVNLQQSTKDPTVVFVAITIQNRSFDPITLERGLKLPQPYDLLGSTSQQGAMRQSLLNYVSSGE